MLKTYMYRIYPSKKQKLIIDQTLETCRRLYNTFLYERKAAYKNDGKSITYHQQAISLPQRKKGNAYLEQVYSQVLQDVAKRADRAFRNFFRRTKAGEKPGYPRYKGEGRYNSFTYPQSGYGIENGKLKLSYIGSIKINLHREMEGAMKTCTIRRRNGKYYVCFSCEAEATPLEPTGRNVGIDMGVADFCITSDEEFFPSPRTYRKAEKALRRAHKKVSRRKKGSKRGRKAAAELARAHEKVAGQRRDIAHKTASKLIGKYDMIAHEKLQIKNMVKNRHLSKSITDAGWGIFFGILSYKAESAGRKVIEVDPYNTSQICSECGSIVSKKLSERWHKCPVCGYSAHRDVNAARNILNKAIA